MNIDSRLLPRLSQLYMQKQSFEIHKKKLQAIKKSYHSRSNSQKNLSLIQIQPRENCQEITQSKFATQSSTVIKEEQMNKKASNSYQIDVIKQHLININKNKFLQNDWKRRMSPLQKRRFSEQSKQNQRLRQKIKKSVSFASNRKQMIDHYHHSQGIKNRLCKFSMKSEKSNASLKNAVALHHLNKSNKLRYEQLKPKIPLHLTQSPPKLSQNHSLKSFRQHKDRIKQKRIDYNQNKQSISSRKSQHAATINRRKSNISSISNILIPKTSDLKKPLRIKTQQSRKYNRQNGSNDSSIYFQNTQDQKERRLKNDTKLSNEKHNFLIADRLNTIKVAQPFKNKFLREQIMKKRIMNYQPKVNKFQTRRTNFDKVKTIKQQEELQLNNDRTYKILSFKSNKTNLVQISKLRRQNYTQLKNRSNIIKPQEKRQKIHEQSAEKGKIKQHQIHSAVRQVKTTQDRSIKKVQNQKDKTIKQCQNCCFPTQLPNQSSKNADKKAF